MVRLTALVVVLAAIPAGAASSASFAPRRVRMDVPGEGDLGCSWDYVRRQKVVTCAIRTTVPSYRVTISDRRVVVYRKTGAAPPRVTKRFVHAPWRVRPLPKRVPPRRPPPARRFVFPAPDQCVFLPGTDIACQWSPAFDGNVQCRLDRVAISYGFFLSRKNVAVFRYQPSQLSPVVWIRNHDGRIPGR